MVKLVNIPEDEATSFYLAGGRLGDLVLEILPNHKLVLPDSDTPQEVTPYVTMDITESSGFHDNGLGNKPIYHEMDELGVTTDVYQEKCTCRIRTYKGNAFFDLKKVKSAISQPEIHYKYFGNDGIIGITSVGSVRRTPTVIDYQKLESGATMLVTLTYLHKVVNGDGFPIEKVIFDATTSAAFVGGESITDKVTIDPSS